MTGKVIDRSANTVLILLLPLAFLCVLLFRAWPYLLTLFLLAIGINVWRHYEWLRWSQDINPFFNQLIKENQGCLTPLDLSLKANITGSAAQRYLDRKAEEFGAKRQVYEDRGAVYYFLTASALGSIFESSEPLTPPQYESLTSQAPKLIQLLTDMDSDEAEPSVSTDEVKGGHDLDAVAMAKEVVLGLKKGDEDDPLLEDEAENAPLSHPFQNLGKLLDDDPDEEEEIPAQPTTNHALIQSELAKRLDVHPSTIGKHKSDSDFSAWSQSKDPQGIAWIYSPETKAFLPVEHQS